MTEAGLSKLLATISLSTGCGDVQLATRREIGCGRWNDFVDEHPLGTWWHRYDWLDYCLAYRNGKDCSFGVLRGGDHKVVALFPVVVEQHEFLTGGNPSVPAIIKHDAELTEAWFYAAKYILDTIIGLEQVRTGEVMLPFIAGNQYEKLGIETAAQCVEPSFQADQSDFTTRIVDLSVPASDRWHEVRKSYKQLIKRGNLAYNFRTPAWEQVVIGGMAIYEQLHTKKFGAVRSEETYRMQHGFARNGHAFPYVFRRVTDHQPVGVALWYLYKGLAYYASGVYLEENLAHAAVWESMNDLAAFGAKHAELGWSGRATDSKGKAVEFFKRGFGGADWPVKCSRYFYTTSTVGANA